MLERESGVVADGQATPSAAPDPARKSAPSRSPQEAAGKTPGKRSARRRRPAAENKMPAEEAPDPQAQHGPQDPATSGTGPAEAGASETPQVAPEASEAPADGESGADEPAPDETAEQAPRKRKRRRNKGADAEGEGEGTDSAGTNSDEAPTKLGPGNDLSDEELERRLSALLFASPDPLGVGRLANLLEGPAPARVQAALEALGRRLEASGLPVELREIAGGHQLLSTADVFETVARLAKVRREEKVSPAALETLSVVAYRQPVTKAEIEAIRGVQVGPILRALVDRRLVRVVGRAEVPGQPLLYGTTKRFLETFGLAGLKELPRDSELVRD